MEILQVKVIHAYKKWEEIQRDVLELTKLKERISEERDYSGYLKDSFQKEIQKLTGYQSDLLKLEIETKTVSDVSPATTTATEDGKKLYQKNETDYRNEVIQDQISPEKKETKKKTERPVYKY